MWFGRQELHYDDDLNTPSAIRNNTLPRYLPELKKTPTPTRISGCTNVQTLIKRRLNRYKFYE